MPKSPDAIKRRIAKIRLENIKKSKVTPPPPVRCHVCNREFYRTESTGGGCVPPYCQDCWELDCSKSWHEMMKGMEPTGYPDEYRRVS